MQFRVEDGQATLARTPSFIDLAGSVPVPEDKRELPWEEIRRKTREARSAKHQ